MIDVKKFISGFLILAVAAIASGLMLSYFGGSNSAVAPSAEAPAGPQIVGIEATSSGAFADQNLLSTATSTDDFQAELTAQLNTTSTEALENDPSNLTNVFANSMLNGLVSANPDGVQTDSSGNEAVNAPDYQVLATELSGNPAVQSIKAPDWNAEAAGEKIIITNDNSQTAANTYITALQGIYQKYIGGSDIGSILGEENPGDAEIINTHTQQALNAALAVPTPSSLVGFQKSFLTLLVYEKNSAALIENANSDPVKTSLVFQAEEPNYDTAINNFQAQWQKAAGGEPFPTTPTNESFISDPGSNQFLSIANQFFGINTAHAQLAVFDAAVFGVESGNLSVNSAALGKTIEKYVEDILLQILKNVLTTLLQQKVLTWIQGSGAPRFVTNWADELTNSFATYAQNKLSNWMQCIPTYQQPIINALLTTPQTSLNNVCGAEFNSQLSYNLQNLSTHFTNFTDYLDLFQPGGNSWGLVLQVQDSVYAAGATAQQANTNQNIAQQGWSGTYVCDDGSSPHGTRDVCVSSDGKNYTINPNDPNDTCDPSDQLEFIPNNGACADGSAPTLTSPGQATGQGFFSGLKSGAENLTSATNIAGLLNALLSSLLNTLAQSAINYSTTALNNAINGTGGSQDAGLVGINPDSITVASTTVEQSGAQCIPVQQTSIFNASTSQATASFSAAGGAIDSTCAASNSCPSTENPDGSPIYSWLAPGSLSAASGTPPQTGDSFFTTYSATGTYAVTVTASTDNSTSTCEVTVQ